MTVTPLHPAVEHFDTCDTMAMGAAAQRILAAGGSFLHRDTLLDLVNESRRDGSFNCGCAKLRLSAVLTELAAARKALQSRRTPAHEDRVRQLLGQRDALRAEVQG